MSKENDNLVKARELLGVDASASHAEIRKAYKKAALQHHPDKGGDPERFKAVGLAVEVLTSDSGQPEPPEPGPPEPETKQGCSTPWCSEPGYMVHTNGRCGKCNKEQEYRDFKLGAFQHGRIVKTDNGKFGNITVSPTFEDHRAGVDLLDGSSIWVDAKTLTRCYNHYDPEEKACLEEFDRLLNRIRKERAVKANKAKGKLAAEAGNWEEAVEAYQAAVNLMPDNKQLKAALVEAEEQKEEALERKVKQWPRLSALGWFGDAAKAKKAEIDKQEQEDIANAWAQAWPVSPAVGGGKLKQKRGKNKKNRTKKKQQRKTRKTRRRRK